MSAVIAAPILALAVRRPGLDRVTVVDAEAWLVLNLCLFAGAAMLYLRWRITDESSDAWLTSAAVAVAVAGIPTAMMDLAASAHPGASGRLAAVVLLVPVPLAIVLAVLGTRFPQRLHPLTIGGALGLGALTTLTLGSALPVGSLPPQARAVLIATMVLAGIALFASILALATRRGLATPAPLRLAAITAPLLTAALYPVVGATPDFVASWFLAVSFSLLGAGLANSSAVLLLEALAEQSRALLSARTVLEAPRSRQRAAQEEEIFHELRATVADITSATRALRRYDILLTPGRKHRLERMLDSEISRLHRLLGHGGDRTPTAPVPLDDALEPQVQVMLAQGHDVRWRPTRYTVLGRVDDIAEIVHILLANARRHAPGAPVTVAAVKHGDQVELTVSDLGPGVPPDLAPRLFDPGARSSGSPGEGLGLCAAQRLARGLGGQVRLKTRPGARGATFVVTLPSAAVAVAS